MHYQRRVWSSEKVLGHPQGTTHGLAIILLDALIGKDNQDKPVEWIKEEDLAESLNLHIKLVRKTLRFLEQVRLQVQLLLRVASKRFTDFKVSTSITSTLCMHHIVFFQLTAIHLPVS